VPKIALGSLEVVIFDTQHAKELEMPEALRAKSEMCILKGNQMASNQSAFLLSARREILRYPGKACCYYLHPIPRTYGKSNSFYSKERT